MIILRLQTTILMIFVIELCDMCKFYCSLLAPLSLSFILSLSLSDSLKKAVIDHVDYGKKEIRITS